MLFKKIFFKAILLCAVFFITFLLGSYFKKDVFNKVTTVHFNSLEYDFGKIQQNNPKNIYFVYKNTGNNPFIIKQVNTTCGCTTPKWSNQYLKPKQKDSILVSYDSKTLGYFSKSIFIISNSKENPIILYIKGVVVKNNSKN